MARGLVRIGIDNPVLLHLVFFLVVIAGLGAYVQIPKEEFPQVATDRVVVSARLPGATAADVEDLLVRPLEDAVEQVGGLEHVFAEATEGFALLTLEFVRGTDVAAAQAEVHRVVSDVGLPDEASTPRVSVARLRIPLAHVALTGDPRQRALAEALADELLAVPGVREVRLQGVHEAEVRVTLDAALASALRLSPQEVVDAIAGAATGIPAGDVVVEEGDVPVQTQRGVRTAEDLGAVVLRRTDHGVLRLRDVARVERTWTPPDVTVRVNGQPAIDLVPLRQDDADALDVVPAIEAWASARATSLPPGLGLVSYDDSARMVADRLKVLASNGLVGIVLVFVVLLVFVGLRNALLVVWGMPVAYLGGLAAMYAFDQTLNVVSTFGLLLVTGIIVDDAVVIVENVQRHLEEGKDRLTAALDGTSEVVAPVFAATLTTCLAFAPLLMLDGTVGRVMRIVPIAVILALVASLLEAFVVLPGHLAHHAEEARDRPENLATRWLRGCYTPMLDALLVRRRRGWVLGGLGVVVTACLALGTTMPRSLTTPGKPVFAFVNVTLPPSSDADATREVVRFLEDTLAAEGADLALYAAGRVGEQLRPQAMPRWGAHRGQLKIGFRNDPEVLARVPAFLDRVRAALATRPEVARVEIETLTGGPPVGKPVDLRVRGPDDETAWRATRAIVSWLRDRPGVFDVDTELDDGARSWEVQVSPGRAASAGVREAMVAASVRASLAGLDAVELPLHGRTTSVRVAWPAPATHAQVGDVPVWLPDGRAVRVREVAEVARTTTSGRLTRVDGRRAVRVTAEIDGGFTSSAAERGALDRAFDDLGERFEGADLFFGGELADTSESFGQLPWAAALALLLIYAVLAVQFASYLQPLLILLAVPLGGAGVVLGLFTLGMDLSFIAMIGAVALVGIVVNDALVLVDFVNKARLAGAAPLDAVRNASLIRLRPILITTVTTVMGLLPLALGLAGEDPLLAPMAVAVSFGLAISTGLTLLVLPVAYLVLEDLVRWGGSGQEPGGDGGEPDGEQHDLDA